MTQRTLDIDQLQQDGAQGDAAGYLNGFCGLCNRPSDELLDRGFGLRVCLACRRLERARYEQATGRCARGCPIAPSFHPDPDRCPEEFEARALAGDR